MIFKLVKLVVKVESVYVDRREADGIRLSFQERKYMKIVFYIKKISFINILMWIGIDIFI